jgi:four helix bundle protein
MLRAAKSIPRNIAEGNEKQSLKDQNRFFQIARGSALECAAIDDILLSFQAIDPESNRYRRKQSSTSTSTVRRGGLSTSTRKTHEKKMPDRMCSLQRPFFPLTLGTPF